MERLAPFCVYVITCTVSGKQYVGKAADPEKRWAAHWAAKNSKSARHRPLYRALRKHGKAAFTLSVLSWHDTEAGAFAGERASIARLGTLAPSGYNLTEGGEGAEWTDAARTDAAMRRWSGRSDPALCIDIKGNGCKSTKAPTYPCARSLTGEVGEFIALLWSSSSRKCPTFKRHWHERTFDAMRRARKDCILDAILAFGPPPKGEPLCSALCCQADQPH